MLIVFGYMIVGWWLFEGGANCLRGKMHRYMLATLGMAFFCFGVGRFLTLMGEGERWIYTLGHFALIAFGAQLALYARRQVR